MDDASVYTSSCYTFVSVPYILYTYLFYLFLWKFSAIYTDVYTRNKFETIQGCARSMTIAMKKGVDVLVVAEEWMDNR